LFKDTSKVIMLKITWIFT